MAEALSIYPTRPARSPPPPDGPRPRPSARPSATSVQQRNRTSERPRVTETWSPVSVWVHVAATPAPPPAPIPARTSRFITWARSCSAATSTLERPVGRLEFWWTELDRALGRSLRHSRAPLFAPLGPVGTGTAPTPAMFQVWGRGVSARSCGLESLGTSSTTMSERVRSHPAQARAGAWRQHAHSPAHSSSPPTIACPKALR
jgi:hypothetical protein